MPEMPEVKTVVNRLNEHVKGLVIKSVCVRLPKLIKNESKNMFIKKLTNKKINKVESIGKFIIFNLSGDNVLISHLRMEGKYRTQESNEFSKHDHIIFKLNNTNLIYTDTRQFGTFHIFNKLEYKNVSPINKLGEIPKNIDQDLLFKKFQRKSIAIKTALLDQTLVVGLGNIYVNEVLWHEKIDPSTPCNKINYKKLISILKTSQKILDEATKMGGTTIHSFKSFGEKQGNYQDKLRVHGRQGLKCYKCKQKISKKRVNGRGTYYCHECQKPFAKI